MWLLLALLGHLLNAFVYITDKAFVVKFYPNPKALAFISGAVGAFTFLLFPWFLKWAPPDVILAGIGSGLISIPALVYFFVAIQRDEISRVVPAVGSMVPLFTFGLSYWILLERLGDKPIATFGLLALGGLLIASRSFKSVFQRGLHSLLLLEIFVAFLFALSFVLQKYAFEGTEDFSAFLWSRVGTVAAAVPLLFSADVRAKIKLSEFSGSGFKMGVFYAASRIFAGLSPLVILLAISFGSVSLVNSLQGIQYALLFLLAILFSRRWPDIFKEEITRGVIIQKSIATALIIIGLALLV